MESLNKPLLSVLQTMSSADHQNAMKALVENLKVKVDAISKGACLDHLCSDISSDLEAFQHVIYMCVDSKTIPERLRPDLEVVLSDCVKNVFIPLIRQLSSSEDDSRVNLMGLLTLTCDALVMCSKQTDSSTQLLIWQLCLDSLHFHAMSKDSVDLTTDSNTIDMRCVVELLRCLLKDSNGVSEKCYDKVQNIFPDDSWNEKLFRAIIDVIINCGDKIVGEIVSLVLIKLLRYDPESLDQRLTTIWESVCELFLNLSNLPTSGIGGRSSVNDKPYIVLCCLADFYIPVLDLHAMQGKPFYLLNHTVFWDIIQSGLAQKNPVTRKRSLYLLKRIISISETEAVSLSESQSDKDSCCDHLSQTCPIFSWPQKYNSQLSKIWENFILLIETLNEKQIHVVRPLFPRLNHLIEASSKTQVSGFPLLHTSWIITVIRRALIHESFRVIIWGIKSLLQADPKLVPVLLQGQDQFISGEFLFALKETRLYCRDTDDPVGSQPEVGNLLSSFLFSCWSTLDTSKRAKFFKRMMLTIKGENWGMLPLLYLSQALSKLPAGNLWDKESLLAIREIMSTSLTTLEPFTRGAVQCFFLESLVNLVDVGVVSPPDLAVVLSGCSRDESLQRGTTLWQKISSRLLQIAFDNKSPANWTKRVLTAWLQNSVCLYLKAEEEEAIGYSLQLSRMILLFIDGSSSSDLTVDPTEVSFLDKCLSPVIDILSRLISHAYLSVEKGDRAVGLLMSLLEEAESGRFGEVDIVMKKLLSTVLQFLDEIIFQIIKGKDDMKSTKDLPRLHFYLHVLKILSLPHCVEFIGGHRLLQPLSELVHWSINITDKFSADVHQSQQLVTEQTQMTRLFAMSLLAKSCEILSIVQDQLPASDRQSLPLAQEIYKLGLRMRVESGLAKPSDVENMERYDGGVGQKAWGRLVTLYLHSQWVCLGFIISSGQATPTPLQSLDPCFEALVLGARNTTLPVIRVLQTLLPEFLKNGQEMVVVQAIERVWHRIIEDRRGTLFIPELRAFVAMAYQEALLQSSGSDVSNILTKYAGELFVQGEEKMGIVNLLVNQLCATFSQGSSVSAFGHFTDIVAEACVFGSLPQRVEKTRFESNAYIDQLGKDCAINELLPYEGSPNVLVRVMVVNFLTKLKPMSEDHCAFMSCLIQSLIQKHEVINKTLSAWNFSNSLQHRLRHRLTQTLLICEPFIQSKDLAMTVWTYIWDMLLAEAQPSVRNMLEWLTVRLLIRHRHLQAELWNLFEVTSLTEKRHMTLCSLMFIVAHLGCHLSSSLQESYYSKAILVIFPWCTVHHFNTRIHAQVCLKKLWSQCQQFDLQPLTDQYPIIQSCLNFTEDERNSTKNAERLEAHYIFSTFNAVEDYSVETIYEVLPRLACLSDEEWISPSSFQRTDATWCEKNTHYLPLHNLHEKLKNFNPGPWRLKGEESYANHTEVEFGEDGDVQKKILPWRFMKPDAEAEEQLELRRMKKRGDGLILVTSLIEKIPNLGGLCRTSEIFGVSEFVVGNMQCVHDKGFQSLSVTAHKWLPITEVKPFQIKEYLLNKRRHGYTLVGVEQTANSVCLTDYRFPQKTLLLLGHEKGGIPANLIQFLDHCVEIPQQGVIRSLNVHVSGALFVWEYTRQQHSTTAHQCTR